MTRLCLSVAPGSMREARHELVTAPADAELIELRIDAIADLDIPRLLQRPRKKVIVTNRRKSEGGKYGGSADKQFDILAQSAKLGAEYIDAEFSWGKDFIKKLSKEKGRAKLICSYHDFSSTPANIAEHCKKMCETGADIVKIATTAKDIVDCKRLFDLHQIAQKAKCSLIVVGMGERGQITRILSGKFGGYLTYASEDELSTTAPGQLALEDMKTVYQVHLLDKRTKVFGLIGNPVSQSKGVNFHNSLFQRKSLNSVYVNCLVDNLQTFLPAFRDVFSGFSVTMPFKEQIVLALDKIDPAVSELGVANTVINNHDRLEGYNTDLLAIEQLLKERADLRGKKAIVLGTGGTSRAMAYAAQRRGAAVTVVGRTLDKVQRLAVEFGCNFALAENLSELSCDLLMNGTPLGMKPESDPLPVPSEFLKSGMIVFDAVYTPEVTPLLRMATFNGCKIIKGTELFHQQGMFQHDLFMRVA